MLVILICTSCKQTWAKEGERMVVESIGLLESGSTLPHQGIALSLLFIPAHLLYQKCVLTAHLLYQNCVLTAHLHQNCVLTAHLLHQNCVLTAHLHQNCVLTAHLHQNCVLTAQVTIPGATEVRWVVCVVGLDERKRPPPVVRMGGPCLPIS